MIRNQKSYQVGRDTDTLVVANYVYS